VRSGGLDDANVANVEEGRRFCNGSSPPEMSEEMGLGAGQDVIFRGGRYQDRAVGTEASPDAVGEMKTKYFAHWFENHSLET
jgi:hypothetical protein